MRRVMLVDDEPYVLLMLDRKVNWAAHGYEIVARARDGREALEMLSKSGMDIDVVITDLNMPVMDGFELIRHISKMESLDCAVVVLSIYNDYESIREAFRLGAVDYILKHEIEEETVIKVLSAALINRRLGTTRDLVQAQFIAGLHDARNLGAIGEMFAGARMLLCVCSLCGKNNGDVRVLPLCRTALADYPEYLICESDGYTVILLRLNPAMNTQNKWLHSVYTLSSKVNAGLTCEHESIIMGVSDPIDAVLDIAAAYAQATARLHDKFFYPEALVFPGRGDKKQTTIAPDSEKDARVLADAAFEGKQTRGIELLNRRADEFCYNLNLSRAQTIGYFKMLIISLSNELSDIIADAGFSQETIEHLDNAPDIKTALALTQDYYERWFDVCKTISSSRNQRLARDAALYIDEHFSMPLTLKQVAKQVNLSANYFSSLFAHEMGMSFSAYLVKVRIREAMRMLSVRTDSKIYEIAASCGFASVEHFSRTFKSETGVSPTRYRVGIGKDFVQKDRRENINE